MAAEDRLTITGKYIPLMLQNGPNTFHQIEQNQPAIVLFNFVRTINADNVRLFKLSQVKTLFNAPDAISDNFAVFAGNGDGSAVSVHPDGVTFRGSEWYLTLAGIVNGQIRVSGAIIYSAKCIGDGYF